MAMLTHSDVLKALKGKLLVSVQPVVGGHMDYDGIIVAMAAAAVAGGAAGLRIEGAARVAQVRATLPNVPIVGIVKRNLDTSDVRITPHPEDVAALADAGADIIGIDGTQRPRPYEFAALCAVAKVRDRLVMADISNVEEAESASDAGAKIVGTTLSGYVGGPVPAKPDMKLIEALRDKSCFLIAEGRFDTPELCQQAIAAGADCVTVGSALTRLEVATARFADAVTAAHRENN